MKTFKFIGVAAFALAAILISSPVAHAAFGEATFYNNDVTLPAVIPVANSPTNFATPIVIDCSKQDKIAFTFVVSSADSSSTTNVTFKGAWANKLNATNSLQYADTNNAVTLTACVAGGTKFVTVTNTITASGRGYFVLYQESIGANSQITNNLFGYPSKINAP